MQGDQPRILIFVNVEDDRAGDRVKNVAGSQMAVGLKQHLERESDVQKSEAASAVEGIHARGFGGALFK